MPPGRGHRKAQEGQGPRSPAERAALARGLPEIPAKVTFTPHMGRGLRPEGGGPRRWRDGRRLRGSWRGQHPAQHLVLLLTGPSLAAPRATRVAESIHPSSPRASPSVRMSPQLSPRRLGASLSTSRGLAGGSRSGTPPDPCPQSLEAAGRPPGSSPPQPADLGRTARVHLPRTTAPASAPGGLRPARLPRSPAARSSPGSGCPAAEPWSCGPSGAPASPPLAPPAQLGPPAASAPGACSPSASLRSRGGGLPPAPLGVWPADLVAGARRGGPGGSCSPRWAAAGASTGGVGLRPAARVTSSSPGVSVSCRWMASLGQGNPWP